MSANPNRLSQFWKELKRRKVIRVITVYAAAAFAILEVVSIIVEPLRLPEWTLPFMIVLICVGFIIAVILSWIYDIHPEEGIVKTESSRKESQEPAVPTSKGWKIVSYISFVVIAGLILFNVLHRANPTEILDKSIAVLPFEDMSAEQDQEYFCDGMAEEIINSLTKLDNLRVIARTSTFAFKDKQEDIREIGRILNVSTVLEGSIQKVGNHLRITAQLINVEDGSHLWSERYDRELEDVFMIQDEISQSIVNKLRVNLLGKKDVTFENRQTENIEAYNYYLKGRFFWHRRTEEDLLKSMEQFEAALGIDPSYALAYAGLADVYFIMTWWGYCPRSEGFEKAKAYAFKALEINDKLPEAHATLGGILTWYDWDWKGAEKELRLAISLNPNDANAYQYCAELMNVLGRNSEAREYIDKALELNPHSQIMYNLKAGFYYADGEYEKAIEQSWKSLEISEFGWPMIRLFKCYIRLGKDQEALKYLKEIVLFDPSFDHPEVLDSVLMESGREGLVRWFANWLQHNESSDFYYNVNQNSRIARLHGLIGDTEMALVYLEKSWEAEESNLPGIKFSPDLALLRDQPRFKTMLTEMGL